jgi:hypothetical protein
MILPKRANRSDWWATASDGRMHAIGHFKWVDWKTLTYLTLLALFAGAVLADSTCNTYCGTRCR